MSGEILSADELEPARQFVGFVKRNGGTQGAQRNSAADLIERLLVSHEAQSRRLAEVEAERDYEAQSANHHMRLAGLLGDDLRAAERRLAEVEQALLELVDACKTNPNADMWQELVVRVAEAVLDKGEPEPCA